jgi:hypothetical protein
VAEFFGRTGWKVLPRVGNIVSMDVEKIGDMLRNAHSLADLKSHVHRERPSTAVSTWNPWNMESSRISPQDLIVIKEKFPSLTEFTHVLNKCNPSTLILCMARSNVIRQNL